MLKRLIWTSVTVGLVACTMIWCYRNPSGLQVKRYYLNESKLSAPRSGATLEYLMVHFCSDVMVRPQNPFGLENLACIFCANGISCHYIIDREGVVYRMIKEERAAYHAGNGELQHALDTKNRMNDVSIGIELMGIGSVSDMKDVLSKEAYGKLPREYLGFTATQYVSLKLLIEDIRGRWPGVKNDRKHIIGHSEYATGRRTDPGELFDWSQIGL